MSEITKERLKQCLDLAQTSMTLGDTSEKVKALNDCLLYIAHLQAQLAAKERQLEAAANEFGTTDDLGDICPADSTDDCTIEFCKQQARRRWEEGGK